MKTLSASDQRSREREKESERSRWPSAAAGYTSRGWIRLSRFNIRSKLVVSHCFGGEWGIISSLVTHIIILLSYRS